MHTFANHYSTPPLDYHDKTEYNGKNVNVQAKIGQKRLNAL